MAEKCVICQQNVEDGVCGRTCNSSESTSLSILYIVPIPHRLPHNLINLPRILFGIRQDLEFFFRRMLRKWSHLNTNPAVLTHLTFSASAIQISLDPFEETCVSNSAERQPPANISLNHRTRRSIMKPNVCFGQQDSHINWLPSRRSRDHRARDPVQRPPHLRSPINLGGGLGRKRRTILTHRFFSTSGIFEPAILSSSLNKPLCLLWLLLPFILEQL